MSFDNQAGIRTALGIASLIALLIASTNFTAQADTVPERSSVAQREAQIERILGIANSAIANPAFLESDAWIAFATALEGPGVLKMDDAEFRAWFNEAVQALPFTHFRLFWNRSGGPSTDAPAGVSVREVVPGTALLDIDHFEVDVEVMTAALTKVLKGGYRTLVIDLRGNEGGSFPSVLALARFLVREPVDAGVFLTRKWFVENGGYPDGAERAAIAALETLDLAAFSRQLEQDGAVRLVMPAHAGPVFEGQVAILTDNDTGSAAEPFVYLMQLRGIPVIGERTAGAMLSAERMPIDETFVLFVPVADYMAPDGTRLDKRGVRPDVAVPADQALHAALEEATPHSS